MSRSRRFQRRAFLGGGIGAGIASLFLRQLEAAAADGPPTRILLVHKPCGTVLERFFPSAGNETSFTLGPITAPFEPLKNDLVIFDNVTASRNEDWQGDRHGAGLICMTTGSRAISNGTPVDTDPQFHALTAASPSVDQLLRTSPKILGSSAQPLGSAHLGAYRDAAQTGLIYSAGGAPGFRVLSFEAPDKPHFPEWRPDIAVQNIFGSAVNGGADAVARQQQLNKSILDLVAKDIGELSKRTPASERPKLDAHFAAIQQLEAQVNGNIPATCMRPVALPALSALPPGTPAGLRIDALDHTTLIKTQLNTLKVAFQCDLIRTATFSFGHGNSDVQFAVLDSDKVNATQPLHETSHQTDSASLDALTAMDIYYSQQLTAFLLDLKNTKESDGSSMLDNTLVVLFSDVSIGNVHGSKRMPVIFFGGKSLGLKQGRWLDMHGRYMNDIWASTLAAFGVTLPADNKFAGYNEFNGVKGDRLGEGAVGGIFA
jgi:hypothetical protein